MVASDEHQSRQPDCKFFVLVDHLHPKKKTGRAKAARGSKAARLSVQSVATAASETTMADLTTTTLGNDDTVLTIASTRTTGRKRAPTKKAAAAATKGKNAKTKQTEVLEEDTADITKDESSEEPFTIMQAGKVNRGKKRGSDAMEESILATAEAPAPKKRATRTEGSILIDSSIVTEAETVETVGISGPKNASRGKAVRSSKAKSRARKVSTRSDTSIVSIASPTGAAEAFPDDDEIERQLQADLDRMTDDEDIAADSDSELRRTKLNKSMENSQQDDGLVSKSKPAFAMFDPTPYTAANDHLEDELHVLASEMEVTEAPSGLHVPKKTRKAGTRKASKKGEPKKPVLPSSPFQYSTIARDSGEDQSSDPVIPVKDVGTKEPADLSFGSTDTVVKKSLPSTDGGSERNSQRLSRSSMPPGAPTSPDRSDEEVNNESEELVIEPAKRGPGRPSKASRVSQDSAGAKMVLEMEELADEAPVKRGRGRPSKASTTSQPLVAVASVEVAKMADAPAKRGRGRPPKRSMEASQEVIEGDNRIKTSAKAYQVVEQVAELVEAQADSLDQIAEQPEQSLPSGISQLKAKTPVAKTKLISPAPSARQPVLSPSPSPQSSDAENQPPSSRPASSVKTKRVALAPMAATPTQQSPSKRNIVAGLQSSKPWTAIDIDVVFGTPKDDVDKENAAERVLRKGKELTSPEKGMTVQEWLYFNAGQAEQELRHECETMVSRFESEGSRAMMVLEGLHVLE